MRAIQVVNPGQGYSLTVADIAKPVPVTGEVLIKVAAAGLNRADLAQAMGFYPPPPGAPTTLGLEVSGVVQAIGEGVHSFEVGDAVCALLGGGGYAEFAAVSEKCVLPVPDGVDVRPVDLATELQILSFHDVRKSGEPVLASLGAAQ